MSTPIANPGGVRTFDDDSPLIAPGVLGALGMPTGGSRSETRQPRGKKAQGVSRVAGTISPGTLLDREKAVKAFLAHVNERRGVGAASGLRIKDLTTEDRESSNRDTGEVGIATNTLARKMQAVKGPVDRAGRPESPIRLLTSSTWA